jgi:LPS-assembly protein
MRRLILTFLLLPGSIALTSRPAEAQTQPSGCTKWLSGATIVQKVAENHWKLTGRLPDRPVVIDCDTTQIVADEMEIFDAEERAIGRGHVVYVSGTNRIAADRFEFNWKTKTGTFYDASGTAHLGERADRSMFGTQEPYAYFFGQELHKLGPKKFKIVRGGFTTCVQPTPRWDITAGSVTIVLEEHAILKNSIFKVKGVPVMYLPAFYYPIQEDDRATGFLMPIYGNSTYRGQTLTNQFFWAISRSQDATLMHDWFSKTGQGYGGEYRYIASPTSSGNASVYFVNEKATTTTTSSGAEVVTPGLESYTIRSAVTQGLPARTRMTASIDYFSSVQVQQLYQQSLFESSKRTRNWSVSTISSWSGFTASSGVSRNEIFLTQAESQIEGARPRFNLSRTATKLGAAPVYVSGHLDVLNLQREFRRELPSGDARLDTGLTRIDGRGAFTVPFPTFSFLSVNSSLTWNGTHYSKSLDPVTSSVVEESLARGYVTVATELIGPSIVRIWNRPQSQYATRVKHLIEPRVQFSRTTRVENVDRILKYDSSDYLIGGSTQVRYGVASRLLRKPGDTGVSSNLLSVSVTQTYYTDPATSQYDPDYGTSFGGQRTQRPPSAFSPVSINATFTPVPASRVNARVEYDPIISTLQSLSVGGETSSTHVFAAAGLSRRRLSQAEGDAPSDTLLTAGTQIRTRRNMLGGTYSIDYDFGRSTLVQQKIQGYYNAQCCGLIIEYQRYNYANTFNPLLIPTDRRFNISFSLGGIGTFSNFLGALTGQPTRR